MEREKEIKILINYLKMDVVDVAKGYPALLVNRIIDNGKLIESYQLELENIKKEKGL